MRTLFVLTAFVGGGLIGAAFDDWVVTQMIKDGFYPAGYHCERIVHTPDVRQVP